MPESTPKRSPEELDRVKVPGFPVEQGPPTEKINGSLGASNALAGRTRCSDDLPLSTSGVGQPLSKRKASILAFVRDFTARNPYPPTVQEIARRCSLSGTSHVIHHLLGLEKMGYITRTPRVSRSIVLTELGRAVATA